MNNTKGWVKLPRAIMDDPSYLSGNVTEVMAWIDLILMAAYESTSVYVRGHRYDIERGQLIASIRELSSRWRWGTHHVINFLKRAEDSGKLIIMKNNVTSLITVNYYDCDNKEKKVGNAKSNTKSNTESNAKSNAKSNAENDVNSLNISKLKREIKKVSNAKGNAESNAKGNAEGNASYIYIKNSKEYKENNNRENIERKKTSFIKPTKQEIDDYVSSLGKELDAEMFIDYYQSNGWKIGRCNMRDWKATVRNWLRRNYQNQNQKNYGRNETTRSERRPEPTNETIETRL